MQKIHVSVCVCASCMLSGAMDIISSIESLKKVSRISGVFVKIIPTACACGNEHALCAPVVCVKEERMENATTQNVMAKILSHAERKED